MSDMEKKPDAGLSDPENLADQQTIDLNAFAIGQLSLVQKRALLDVVLKRFKELGYKMPYTHKDPSTEIERLKEKHMDKLLTFIQKELSNPDSRAYKSIHFNNRSQAARTHFPGHQDPPKRVKTLYGTYDPSYIKTDTSKGEDTYTTITPKLPDDTNLNLTSKSRAKALADYIASIDPKDEHFMLLGPNLQKAVSQLQKKSPSISKTRSVEARRLFEERSKILDALAKDVDKKWDAGPLSRSFQQANILPTYSGEAATGDEVKSILKNPERPDRKP